MGGRLSKIFWKTVHVYKKQVLGLQKIEKSTKIVRNSIIAEPHVSKRIKGLKKPWAKKRNLRKRKEKKEKKIQAKEKRKKALKRKKKYDEKGKNNMNDPMDWEKEWRKKWY